MTKPTMQQQVELFRQKFDLPVSNTPRVLTEAEAELHIKLIREEFEKELVPALQAGDLVETYDAAVDVLYYLLGLFSNAGMDAEAGFEEVQRSNMSKLGADGNAIKSRGEDIDGAPLGKVLKGPNYFVPDLRAVLIAQGADLDG